MVANIEIMPNLTVGETINEKCVDLLILGLGCLHEAIQRFLEFPLLRELAMLNKLCWLMHMDFLLKISTKEGTFDTHLVDLPL
jgi:hypothetical protein